MFRYFVANFEYKQRKTMVYAKIKVTNFSRDRCNFLHFCISAISAALAVSFLVPAGAPGARLVKRE